MSELLVGFANVQKTLNPRDTRADVDKMLDLAERHDRWVLGLCEIEKNTWHHAAVAEAGQSGRAQVYWPDGAHGPANAVPLLASPNLRVIDRGSVKALDGRAHVTPNRYCNWEAFELDGLTPWVIATQFLSSAWTRHHDRQDEWRHHNRVLHDLVEQLIREYGRHGVIVGDFNRDKWEDPHLKMLGASYHWPARGTHGPKWFYDYLITFDAADVTDVHRTRLHSDHDGVSAVVTFDSTRQEVPVSKPLWLPDALHRPVPNPNGHDPKIVPIGDIFHVAVSEADSLQGYFAHRSGGIESTGYIREDGTLEQYRPLDVECDAQGDGNSWIRRGIRYGFNSWETEGMGPGVWTSAQLATIKRIIAFKHTHYGHPLRRCPGPFSPGFGYHCLFAAWNHNAHSCPGPDRVKQFNQIIVPWMRQGAPLTEEDDMADIRVKVPANSHVHNKTDEVAFDTALSMMWWQLCHNGQRTRDNLAEVLDSIPESGSIDAASIRHKLEQAIEDIDVQITTGKKD